MRSAIIFDLDGTLTQPNLNFDAIRSEIGLGPGPILEALQQMDPTSRRRAEEILAKNEWEAARSAVLYDGAVEVVATCRSEGFGVGLLTRNTRPIVDFLIQTHGFVFDAIRTREDGAVKPSPEPVRSICSELSANPSSSWMVGDYLFDIISGSQAGTKTVLMIGNGTEPEFATRADHVIRKLRDLHAIILNR